MLSFLLNARIALVLCAVHITQAAVAQDLTIGLWQGDFAAKYDSSVVDGWRSEFGAGAVVEDFNASTPLARADSGGAMVGFDVVALSGEEESTLCRANKLAKMVSAAAIGTEHLSSTANCGVPFISYGQTIGYNAATTHAPQGVNDFFDLAEFPGSRGLSAFPKGVLEMALLADGVVPDDVYDLLGTDYGLSQAIAKLEQIKTQIVWLPHGSSAVEFLSDGELSMALTWSHRFNQAAAAGAPVRATHNFMLVEHEYLAIPFTAKENPSATSFVGYATSPAGLQTFDNVLGGLYSVPSESVSRQHRDDKRYAQACPRNTCPCTGLSNGCDGSCCADIEGFAGHFEIDEEFWSLNHQRLDQVYQSWRSQ